MSCSATESGGTPTPFKLFGLQGSGTNLAWLLLLQNFELISLENGNEWKHGWISKEHRNWIYDRQPVRLIICIKNPYSWLVSCYNYFYINRHLDPTVDKSFQKSWNFAQFLTTPSYSFNNPIDRWNTLTRHWLEFPAHNQFSELILHESMLNPQDQQEVLMRIETNQHFVRKRKAIYTASRRIGIGMQLQERFNSEYYQQERYLANYSKRLMAFVNESVDTELLKLLGYERVTATPRSSRRYAIHPHRRRA